MNPEDIATIKANVQKLIDAGAPEQDIHDYIEAAGFPQKAAPDSTSDPLGLMRQAPKPTPRRDPNDPLGLMTPSQRVNPNDPLGLMTPPDDPMLRLQYYRETGQNEDAKS